MKKFQSIIISSLFFILLIFVFENTSNILIPKPTIIIKTMFKIIQNIRQDILITSIEAFYGLLIGFAFSLIIVTLIDISSIIRAMLRPIIVASQAIPFFVIAPFVVIFFGYGIAPKVFVVAFICFFPLSLNLMSAFDSVPRELVDVSLLYGANKLQMVYYLKMPTSIFAFFAGIKIGVIYAISGAVIAEFMAGDNGIGVVLMRAKRSYAYDRAFAICLIIVLVSMALYYILDYFEKKYERN